MNDKELAAVPSDDQIDAMLSALKIWAGHEDIEGTPGRYLDGYNLARQHAREMMKRLHEDLPTSLAEAADEMFRVYWDEAWLPGEYDNWDTFDKAAWKRVAMLAFKSGLAHATPPTDAGAPK